MNKPSEAEFIGDSLALIGNGEVIVNYATPEPEIELDSPRPKETGSNPISFWGEANDFPQQIIQKVEADTELGALLDWKGRLLQGKEVIAVVLKFNETTKKFETERIDDDEINGFLASIPFNRYWREACVDFTWFQNIFPDMVKSKGGDKIATLSVHQAAWSRFKKMDNTGTIVNLYVSANWPDAKPEDEYTKTYTVVDPYRSTVIDDLKKKKALKRFVYPVNYPSPGKAYYSLAPWVSFVNSDWYNIKKLIPEWKLKFMKRILSASYVVTIPAGYWRLANKDWDSLEKDEQEKIKKAKVADMNKKLTGIEGVGATLLSEVGTDPSGNPVNGFTFTPIASGFTDGQHLEDSQEASQHLMRALNVDPTLVGNGPGRGKDSGSGSDKRIAMNIQTALLQPYRNVILEPLVFAALYNGWFERYPTLRFPVVEVELQTLDQGATSKITDPVTPKNPEA
ncbi:hypothetical protein DBR40_24720 [Pedobacter sp. KBW01]|uniref:hypothetical protein n=1 Tax=Pedobacter sp. KBW01 TaxID=2153364 RepID=UPI000F59EC36|nr:hypothetical protein [Pedobacter sp. KBW01]RQO65079.1 hypothetical protein DBR40_24720 [Pedobacter sp. KBW01]